MRSYTTPRTVVMGDIGGNITALRSVLVSLGCDPDTGHIPENLYIIQVGDVVRLAPDDRWAIDNHAAAETVDMFRRRNPEQWTQLWGNHDIAVLGAPGKPDWIMSVDDTTTSIITSWLTNTSNPAVFATTLRGVLITHAGMTREYWTQKCGQATSPLETAKRINEHLTASAVQRTPAFGSGMLLGTPNSRQHPADPIWAVLPLEVYPSWAGHPIGMPFDQICGHSRMKPLPDSTDETDPTTTAAHAAPTMRHSPNGPKTNRRTYTETVFLSGESGFAHTITSVDTGLAPPHNPSETFPLLTVQATPESA